MIGLAPPGRPPPDRAGSAPPPSPRPAPRLRARQSGAVGSRTGAVRPLRSPGTASAIQRALTHSLVRLSWLPIVAIIAAHIVFGLEAFPLVARVILAVPAVLFLVESRTYLSSERRELPFLPLALLQFYAAFGLPVFFEAPFSDLGGPVFFSDAVRIEASMVVALGSLSLWGAARIAMRFGGGLELRALAILPPAASGDGSDQAFYVYVGLTLLTIWVNLFAQKLMPGSFAMLINTMFMIEFAIGLATVRPPARLGARASSALATLGIAAGFLAGQIDPMGRVVMTYVSAQWVATRRLAVGFIIALVLIFVVVQPIKSRYRAAAWQGNDIGVVGRVDAWQSAFSDAHDGSLRSQREDSALDRLSHLSPVMNALLVVPSRLDYAYGATLAQLLYAPIPRLIWPEKPTTKEEVTQRYAIIFHLQTEKGAQTTAIGMCLIVEGLWNLGWLGVLFACGGVGLLIGAQQRLFSGTHWALRAAGAAQLANLNAVVPLVIVYGALFQCTVARILSVWMIHLLAQILGTKAGRAPVGGARNVARG